MGQPPATGGMSSTAAEIQKILNSSHALSAADILQFSLAASSIPSSNQTLPSIGQAIPSIQTLGLPNRSIHNANMAGSFLPQPPFIPRSLVPPAPSLDSLSLPQQTSVHLVPCTLQPSTLILPQPSMPTLSSIGIRFPLFAGVDSSLFAADSRSILSPAAPGRSGSTALDQPLWRMRGDGEMELAMSHGDTEGEETRLSRLGQSNQIDSFRRFLYDLMKKEVVVVEELEEGDIACDQELNPLGIKAWKVLRIDDWWVAVKQWFQHDASKFNMRAFFMMLRRIGFRPFNKAPAPATSGMDYALRNKFVNEHGYIFDCETLEKYCQSRRVLTKLKRKMTAASGEGSVDTMESNSSRRKIMD